MTTIWALIANSSFAQVFEIKGGGRDIKEVHHLDNPDGRKKNSEIGSDRPGRAFDSVAAGKGRHAYEPKYDPHTHELQVFAHKLGELLKKGLDSQSFDELVLIAPAQFLGELKKVLPDQVLKHLTKEFPKDLPYATNKDRHEQLCKYLDLWNYKT